MKIERLYHTSGGASVSVGSRKDDGRPRRVLPLNNSEPDSNYVLLELLNDDQGSSQHAREENMDMWWFALALAAELKKAGVDERRLFQPSSELSESSVIPRVDLEV